MWSGRTATFLFFDFVEELSKDWKGKPTDQYVADAVTIQARENFLGLEWTHPIRELAGLQDER